MLVIFSDFEQVEILVLLFLGRLSCVLGGCFLDGCFLDDCFLNGCLLNLKSQKLSSYFVDFEQIKKIFATIKNLFANAVHGNLQDMSKSVLTSTHPFPLVFSYLPKYIDLCSFVWMLKHQKYWYFFLIKTYNSFK